MGIYWSASERAIRLEMSDPSIQMPLVQAEEDPGGRQGASDDEKMQILKETDYQDEDEDRTGVPLTAFNILNNMLGGGVIAFSYAFKETGFGAGVIATLLVGFIATYTLNILADAGKLANHITYQRVAEAAMGRCGSILIGLLQVVTCLTTIVSYNVFMADNLTKLLMWMLQDQDVDALRTHFWGTRAFLTAVPLLVFAIPLSSQKHIGSLSKLGVFTMGCTFLSLVFFGVRLPDYRVQPTLNAYKFFTRDFISGTTIIVSGFMTHESTFVFYNSLHNPTRARWCVATSIGVSVSGSVMLVMGVIGYITFEQKVEGNLLENYCDFDVLINVARLGIVGTLFVAIPIAMYAGREVIEQSFFDFHNFKYARHITIGVIITAISYGSSLITDCLGIVLEISGAVAAAPLAFVMPPLIYLRLQPKQACRQFLKQHLHVCLVLAFGVFVVISGIANIIIDIVNGEVSCLEGHQPSYCVNGLVNRTITIP